jgi:hypothetical protein
VTPEQVKARHGKVRCGRCQHVFDAIEFLVDAAPVPTVADQENPPSLPVALEPPPEPTPAAEVASLATAPDPLEALATEPEPETVTPDALDIPTAPPADDILLQPSPLSTTYAPQSSVRAPAWPWAIAAILALCALTAQAMIAFRTDLAAKYPGTRPVLEMLCAQAECIIELPSNPELVSIEASDLHPGKKAGLELTATLRNRAPNTQSWPHLELTLTDGADKPIVRKIITPEQYLPGTLAEADGFEANGELAVQFQLDAGNLPAAGYRLYLFYP